MFIAEIDASVSKNIVIPNVMFLLSYMILKSNTVVHIYVPETGINEPGSTMVGKLPYLPPHCLVCGLRSNTMWSTCCHVVQLSGLLLNYFAYICRYLGGVWPLNLMFPNLSPFLFPQKSSFLGYFPLCC